MNKLTPLCHKNTSKLDLYNHSSFGTRARRWFIPRAPAKPHKCSSSLADTKALQTLGEATSKTHRLRWVHKVQAPRVIREIRPFLVWAGTESVLNSHQSFFFNGRNELQWITYCKISVVLWNFKRTSKMLKPQLLQVLPHPEIQMEDLHANF